MRRADAAAAVSRLLTSFTRVIGSNDPYSDAPFGTALELMSVMTFVIVSTRNGDPRTSTDIAKHLGIPRTTLLRRLETLVSSGRIAVIDSLYVANLKFYDDMITTEMIDHWYHLTLDAAQVLNELLLALRSGGSGI